VGVTTERRRAINAAYRARNREAMREMNRRYQHENREVLAERRRVAREQQTEEQRARKRERERVYAASLRIRLRQQIIERFSGKCARCGFADWRALQVDHVNGGGSDHRKRQSWKIYYQAILEDTDGLYQLLCANCNQIKRYEAGERCALLLE
jgi:hypothetical protein